MVDRSVYQGRAEKEREISGPEDDRWRPDGQLCPYVQHGGQAKQDQAIAKPEGGAGDKGETDRRWDPPVDDSVSRRVPAGDQDPKFREQGLHFGGELAGCLERAAAGAISLLLSRLRPGPGLLGQTDVLHAE